MSLSTRSRFLAAAAVLVADVPEFDEGGPVWKVGSMALLGQVMKRQRSLAMSLEAASIPCG